MPGTKAPGQTRNQLAKQEFMERFDFSAPFIRYNAVLDFLNPPD